MVAWLCPIAVLRDSNIMLICYANGVIISQKIPSITLFECAVNSEKGPYTSLVRKNYRQK